MKGGDWAGKTNETSGPIQDSVKMRTYTVS